MSCAQILPLTTRFCAADELILCLMYFLSSLVHTIFVRDFVATLDLSRIISQSEYKGQWKERSGVASKLSEQIQKKLENAIITGEIIPGTRLEETELASRFETSRTPVREALHALAATGLIEIQPRKGAIVPQAEPQDILEMFEVMAELEASCARFAARRLTEADRGAIREALNKCHAAAKRGDTDAYYELNETLHQAIYRASHNRFLVTQCNGLVARLRPFRRLQLRIPNRMETSCAEHNELVKAIFENRDDDAARIARNHVQIQGSGFYDFAALLRSELR